MFINKINGVRNLGFKGYQHVKNDVGENVLRFNYPYDSDKETCEVQIFKAVPTDRYNYKIVETPIASVMLKPEGVNVNMQDITNLDKDAPFAYKIVRKDKNTGKVVWEGPDTGAKVKPENGEFVFRNNLDGTKNNHLTVENPIYEKDDNGNVIYENGQPKLKDFSYAISDYHDSRANYKYTLVSRKGTTPRVQGAGYLLTPDSAMPGAKFRGFNDPNTGEIYYDKDFQKEMEGVTKTFSNVYGGSVAGLQQMIPYLKQNGYKMMFSTPTANGSGPWCLGYWNKNNMQVSPNMGTKENYGEFFKNLYANGMKYVFDGTFTSEGLEGIHFQYAMRWAEKNPQSYYWFRMPSLKNQSLSLGVVPENKEHLGHRLINSPYKYEHQSNGTYKKVANPDYDKNKETLIQIYDTTQATDKQVKELDRAIVNYENLKNGKLLDINTHDDTIINYVFQIDPKEYQKRIEVINDLNKNFGKNIKLDTPDGTIMASQFSNFRFDRKTDGGVVTWDANTDMIKMNYHISNYDEKINQAIVDKNQRYHEQQMMVRGSYEVRDMAIQAGKYWTGFVKDTQTIYTAKTIGSAKTVEALNKLVSEGKLPEEVKINDIALNNILNGQYLANAPKGVMDKDDVTIKSLMRLPLDALEFGENTVGVLSTSYFSNRATTEETLGMSRFDLMKQNNPHLVEPYAKNYNKVEALFKNEIKSFAESVIKKVDETSNEKLLDPNGDYTEYGEYVMELIGQDIARYALLKSLGGESFKTKILSNGEITYDYDKLKQGTTLKALGINAHNPEDEASLLEKKMEKGLKALSDSDISYVAESVGKRIAGTDTTSFRLAEAMVDKAALGLDWRLDAAKDVMDIDSVRNNDADFDDTWNEIIKFWNLFVQGIKTENPNSYIVAELTDVSDIMRDTTGTKSCPYKGMTDIGQKFNGEPDAMVKFFNETGITAEAAYSYFFTELLRCFSLPFDGSGGISANHDLFKEKLDLLIETRSADYLRNLWTFMGNHDKPRMLHGLALDMDLFHGSMAYGYNEGKAKFWENRNHRLDAAQVLSNSRTVEDIPLELRLNIDNLDYFKTVSPRAIAPSKLLMSVVNEDLGSVASKEDIKRISEAIIDLTNGVFLSEGNSTSLSAIKIPELTSLENAFGAMLKTAETKYGLNLTESERKELMESVVKLAKSQEMLSNYIVQGDFDWAAPNEEVGRANRERAEGILGSVADYKKYSLYTVNLAALLKDAYIQSGKSPAAKEAILKAAKDFVEKYDRGFVYNNSGELPKIETAGMKKQAYAARDIRTAITMAVLQAEHKSGKAIANREQIIDTVYKFATEANEKKAEMITEFLKALPGIPTMYSGDEFGMTGYEEKSKNIYLQNRNALPWTDLDKNGLISDYRKAVMGGMNGAMKDRANPELEALNNGTPYGLDVCNNGRSRDQVAERIAEIKKEIAALDGKDKAQEDKLNAEIRELTKEFAKVAYLQHNAQGNMTVSIFNADGINHSNRFDYFKEYGLDTEDKRKKFFADNNIESINPSNKYIPIQKKSEIDYIMLGAGVAIPVGTVFTNANVRDKAKYVVKEINGKLGIFREGGKIVMDGLTSKNGVMILKHVKNIAFRGNINKQYNIVSNPYKSVVPVEEGQKLSIIAR